MTAYRPNRRDELTQRFARSLAEADENPWAYSEGRAEPQRLVVCADDDDAAIGHRAVLLLSVIGLAGMIVALIAGAI